MRQSLIACSLLALLVISVGVPVSRAMPAHHAPEATARVPHAWVVVMENKGFKDIVGNPNAPYMNYLIRRYAVAARYYGVTHPSLPNYVASIAGDIFNVYDDWGGNRFDAKNIVDQLEARGLSWKAYMGGLPKVGYDGDQYPNGDLALYVRRHDPFMLMTDVLKSTARRNRVVPEQALWSDLRSGRAPALSYISPDLCHDMHGIKAKGSPCPPVDRALIHAGDSYLSRLVPRIMASKAWSGDSVIFIVWDEDEAGSLVGCCNDPKGDGGGLVPAIVIARQGARAYRSRTPYNHYSLLRTLQTVWRLGCLANTCDTRHVHAMLEFLSPQRPRRPPASVEAGGA